ncbi:hypothetical protein Q1695_000109 [Nippostrongylus brasiliensis]|nr:hypothetical protein Q1695_000109 [Nippostrongylus brasiliensis]
MKGEEKDKENLSKNRPDRASGIFATEGHRRWSRGRCRVQVCSSRSGQRQSGDVNLAAIKGLVCRTCFYIAKDKEEGRRQRSKGRNRATVVRVCSQEKSKPK